MSSVRVHLKERSYLIDINSGNLKRLPQVLSQHFLSDRVIILTNTTLARLYQKKINSLLKKKCEWILIPDGEKYKTLQTMEKIYRQLIRLQADRKTPLICLGGGVVGDIGGFTAASFLRGIPFVQIPTSLLAQVDSSVGGKTGVDLPEGKNLVGAFYQPKHVLIDTHFLKTLPRRELLCGLAEVIKYGVIWDERFFSYLEKNVSRILALDRSAIQNIIKRSCEIKAEVVSKDEREGGLRAILNYGHTLGHAIEAVSGFHRIKHGEAISRGMVFAANLSYERGLCDRYTVDRLVYLLEAFGLSTVWPNYSPAHYKKAMSVDKKASGGKIKFIAVKKIGKVTLIDLTPEEIVRYL